MQISYCVLWHEGPLAVARRVDTKEEAEALAREKCGHVESWPTITSGTVRIYGVGKQD